MPKFYAENVQRLKRRRLRVRRIDVCYWPTRFQQGSGLATSFELDCEDPPDNAKGRNEEAVLLLKDLEETNSWARSGFRLFFGWFAWQFTVNAAAIGWLFIYKGPLPALARMVYAMFIGWNLLGTIGTLLVHKSLHDCDLRIKEVIERLTQDHRPVDPSWKPRSAIPLQAINAVFIFCAVSTFMSMSFWTIVFVTQSR